MKPQIIIVEDDPIIVLSIRQELEDAGFAIMDAFSSGEACLKSLQTRQPELIMMDIHLEGAWDGIKTAEEIRKKYRVPILFLTELTEKSMVEKAGKTQASAYLVKPFLPAQLTSMVEFALHQGQIAFAANKYGFYKGLKGHTKIIYADIRYILAEGAYSDVILQDGQKIRITKSLNNLLKTIPDPDLIRIHRSCSINKRYVTDIEGNLLIMEDFSHPVGENYRKEIRQHFDLF